MTRTHLSPELVSLIHHVELNESGWWKKAIGQVIKGVLWKASKPQSVESLKGALRREVGVTLPDEVLTNQLHALSSQRAVTIMPGPSFKLTERSRQDLTEAQQRALGEFEACRSAFLTSCGTHCPALDPLKVWDQFQQALRGAIQVTGANLFHLLADGDLDREVDWVSSFLSRFDSAHHGGLRSSVSDFFAPSNQACRNQVLRLLTAHFFAEASQLRPETLSLIERRKSRRNIKIVLDTNFIFSVLKLHDNPGDDSALSLVDIAERTGGSLDIKLYVLPATLDEAQRTLAHQMSLVDHIRTTVAMSRAAFRQPLPSIAKKFFDAAAKSPGLSARTFFQPYIDDLRTILRNKGIEVLDAHPTIYNQRQDVVDDVVDEMRREERELPEARRKGYEAHLHDAVLWHAVKDRRPELVDSPFDVEYWAVSIDWRLIDFDRRKRASNSSKLPVVLHPSNIVQLIQFWIPRTPELEDSLIDSLRLPLFFQSFDPEDERATVQVLQALSRYENVGDLPEETISSVLTNRALRGRLKEADASNDEIFALVKEELFAEHKAVLGKLEQAKGRLSTTAASLQAERKGREESESILEEKSRELDVVRAKATAAERKAAEAKKEMLTYKQQLLKTSKEANDSRDSLIRTRYVLGVIISPFFIGGGLSIGTYFSSGRLSTSFGEIPMWAVISAVGLIPLAAGCVISPYFTRRYSTLQGWWIARATDWVGKKAVIAPLALGLVAIYQGGVWQWVRAIIA